MYLRHLLTSKIDNLIALLCRSTLISLCYFLLPKFKIISEKGFVLYNIFTILGVKFIFKQIVFKEKTVQ